MVPIVEVQLGRRGATAHQRLAVRADDGGVHRGPGARPRVRRAGQGGLGQHQRLDEPVGVAPAVRRPRGQRQRPGQGRRPIPDGDVHRAEDDRLPGAADLQRGVSGVRPPGPAQRRSTQRRVGSCHHADANRTGDCPRGNAEADRRHRRGHRPAAVAGPALRRARGQDRPEGDRGAGRPARRPNTSWSPRSPRRRSARARPPRRSASARRCATSASGPRSRSGRHRWARHSGSRAAPRAAGTARSCRSRR